jgi:hypothetical protein
VGAVPPLRSTPMASRSWAQGACPAAWDLTGTRCSHGKAKPFWDLRWVQVDLLFLAFQSLCHKSHSLNSCLVLKFSLVRSLQLRESGFASCISKPVSKANFEEG